MARYIDRKELDFLNDFRIDGGKYAGLRLDDVFDELATADVAPVVHSDWEHFKVNGQYKIRCKNCDYIEPEYKSYVRNFCPNCGAKMDKEEDDE